MHKCIKDFCAQPALPDIKFFYTKLNLRENGVTRIYANRDGLKRFSSLNSQKQFLASSNKSMAQSVLAISDRKSAFEDRDYIILNDLIFKVKKQS